jgi:hypothetical protein
MANVAIRSIANWARNSAFVLPAFFFTTLVFIAATIGMGLDFLTNVNAVWAMDIQSFGHPILDFLRRFSLALLPQAIPPVAFAVGFAVGGASKDERYLRYVAFGIAISITLLDIWLGYVFYSSNGKEHPLLLAGLIDTLFSEIAWSFAFGLLVELKADTVKQAGRIFGRSTPQSNTPRQSQSRPAGGQPSLPNMSTPRR